MKFYFRIRHLALYNQGQPGLSLALRLTVHEKYQKREELQVETSSKVCASITKMDSFKMCNESISNYFENLAYFAKN